MKMTIHRALSELKLIDAKIEKGVSELTPLGTYQKGKMIGGHQQLELFEARVKSQYQSITDLIERKKLIKQAIVYANSNTMVTVAGKTMTIADTITHKTIVSFKKKLIERMKAVHRAVIADLNKNNEAVKANLQKLLEQSLGKDNIKSTSNDVEAISVPFLENNEYKLFDPLKIQTTIELLEKEVSEFEMEVDSVLSEINAITIIEV